MLFKGRLRLPSDPGEGIPIDLRLEDVFLSLDSQGEDFGDWRLDKVEIKRLFSNQFSLRLDGEEMVFVASDALGFAYDGLSFVEETSSRLSKRRLFRGRSHTTKKEPKQTKVDEPAPFEPREESAAEDHALPEVVPFFPEPVASRDDSIAASPPSEVELAPDRADEVTPSVSAQPRPFPAAIEQPERLVRLPVEIPEEEFELEQRPGVDPDPIPAAGDASTPAGHVEPVELPEEVEESVDSELVIEDVPAYGYGQTASTSPVHAEDSVRYVATNRPAQPEEPEVDEPDLVIEDAPTAHGAMMQEPEFLKPVATPAHNEAERPEERHPLGDSESEGSALETDGQMPGVDEAVRETVAEASEAHAGATSAEVGDGAFFARWSNGHPEEPAAETSVPMSGVNGLDPENSNVSASDSDAPDSEPSHSGEDAPQTQKSGRHASSERRLLTSRFGRKRSREPAAHEHRYESSKTVGGITRSICAVCDHVSFAGEDVYQGW